MQRPPVNQQRISPGIESTHVQGLGKHEYNVYDKLVHASQEMMAPMSRLECCLAVSGLHMAHPLRLCKRAARDLAAALSPLSWLTKGRNIKQMCFCAKDGRGLYITSERRMPLQSCPAWRPRPQNAGCHACRCIGHFFWVQGRRHDSFSYEMPVSQWLLV